MLDPLIRAIQCGDCLELLYEPLLLPCNHLICNRCYRKSANPVCPIRSCLKPHLPRRYGISTLFQECLDRLLPLESQAYALSKQAEAAFQAIINSQAPLDSSQIIQNVICKYLDHAVQLAPNLQLPVVLRSQVYARLGHENAVSDATNAGYLNHINLKGSILTKMALKQEDNIKPPQIQQKDSTELPVSLQNIKTRIAALCENDIVKLRSLFDESMFECKMCLYSMKKQMPLTTPCGHTFCKMCLLKSMENQSTCPICRSELPCADFMIRRPTIQFFKLVFEDIFELEDCLTHADLSQPQNVFVLPIIPGKLIFPGQQVDMIISEPEERIIVKNCLMGNSRFISCLPETPNCDGVIVQYGCCMEIINFKPIMTSDVIPTAVGNLPRFSISCISRYRVKIQSRWISQLGYMEGQVCKLLDLEPEDGADFDPQHIAERSLFIREYINQRRNTNCLLTYHYVCKKYGNVPQGAEQMCYWVLNLLPISPYVLAEIIGENSLQDRLRKTCEFIEHVNLKKGK